MKKFFTKFSKDKKGGDSDSGSLRRKGSTTSLGPGYEVREKDLGKLHKAAWNGDLTKVKQLAKKDASPLDKENRTPLHLACAKGYALIVQELLEWKAKPNIGDNESRTPLMKAVECGEEECARLLLESRADPNAQDGEGRGSLHYAADAGRDSLVSLLLQCGKTNPDITDNRHQTALHRGVLAGHARVCEVLLDEGGANADPQDCDGRTPLMLACHNGLPNLAQLLLDNDADSQVKDNKGWTAEDVAMISSQEQCRVVIGRHNEKRGIKGSRIPVPAASAATAASGRGSIGPKPPPEFGSPAMDEADDDYSEGTGSKLSEAVGVVDSWADTDEDSELDLKRKKKHRRISPNKNKSPRPSCGDIEEEDGEEEEGEDCEFVEDDISDADQHVPALDLSRILKNSQDHSNGKASPSRIPQLARTGSTGSASSRGSRRDVRATGHVESLPPASARSTTSVLSGLSFGEDKEWSDDESVLSSARDQKKPSLVQLQQQRKNAPDAKDKVKLTQDNRQDSWDDDSEPFSSAREEKGGKPSLLRVLEEPAVPKAQSDFDSDADDVATPRQPPASVPTATANKPPSSSNMSPQRKRGEQTPEIMAQLGLSDVSDVSDMDLTDEEDHSKGPPFGVGGGDGTARQSDWDSDHHTTPRVVPHSARSGVSDWDSTVASDVHATPRTVPHSARSAASEWDSTVAEEEEEEEAEETEEEMGVEDLPDPILPEGMDEVGWESSEADTLDAHSVLSIISAADQQETVATPGGGPSEGHGQASPAQVNEEEDRWDSESEHLSTPRNHSSSQHSNHANEVQGTSEQVQESQTIMEESEGRHLKDITQDPNDARNTLSLLDELEAFREPPEPFGSHDNVMTRDGRCEDIMIDLLDEPEFEDGDETRSAWGVKVVEAQASGTTTRVSRSGQLVEEEVTVNKQMFLTRPAAAAAAKIEDEEESDDDWDSETDLPLSSARGDKPASLDLVSSNPLVSSQEARPTAPPLPTSPPPNAPPAPVSSMYGMDDDDDDDDDEEEESESTWERDRRMEKEKQKSAATAAVDDDEDDEEEERSHRWEEEIEERQRKLQMEAQLELQREQAELLKQRSVEAEDFPDAPAHVIHGDEERSAELRARREEAERELEEAKARQRASTGAADDDTFTGIYDPDMDTPRRRALVQSSNVAGGRDLAGNSFLVDDDDCLSYSSTECEASIHDGYVQQNLSHVSALSLPSDSAAMIRQQEQLRESQRKLDRERSARTSVETKRKSLEKEKAELIQKLEDVTRAKSSLEQQKIDLEAKIRNMDYNLTEANEKKKSAEILHDKVKEQLQRKEEQFTREVEAKQQAELAMRNVQMELRTSMTMLKQMEEEKEDMARQLTHEKHSRQLQEQINDEQRRFQQVIAEDSSAAEQKVEVLGRLETSDESRHVALDTVEKLKAELYAVKMELERQRSRSHDDHEMQFAENEELHQKIEDLKSDIKLNDEALAHASLKYNLELSQLKSENARLISSLEQESSHKDKVESELESLKNWQNSMSTELEKAQKARNDLERVAHTEKDESIRQLAKRDDDVSKLNDQLQTAQQRMSEAESKLIRVENELSISNATLMERTNQLATLQRDLDLRRSTQDNVDGAMRKDKEDNVRLSAKLESVKERLEGVQRECEGYKKQVEEARLRTATAEAADSPDKLNAVLLTLRADHEKTRSGFEERVSSLNETVSRLQEELRTADKRRSELEQEIRQLHTQAGETHRQLSMAQAELQLANKTKDQVESERGQLRVEMERLQGKLDTAKEKRLELQARITELSDRAERAESSSVATSQQLASHAGNLNAVSKTKNDLEENVHKLELENARLDSAMKHETQKVAMLKTELDNANQGREKIQSEVEGLRVTNTKLQFKMDEASLSRTMATHDAEDNKKLWENEVHSRSKLGLRIAQLEREKQEALGSVNEEKRKVRKALEMKKLATTKLEAEQEKATKLQKDVSTLKAHLKAAKRRLQELDTSDHRLNTLHSDFNKERLELEKALSTVRRQLEDSQNQLMSEQEAREGVEVTSRQLQQEVSSLRNMERAHSKLEKAKRRLEGDLTRCKTQIGTDFVEKGTVEQVKAEMEARFRLELNQKLDEVNTYLEEQAQARERLDKMRDNNESEMRREFEKYRADLLTEVDKMKDSYNNSQTEKDKQSVEMQRFKSLYESEVQLRERLAGRLEKANDKVKQTQMFLERQSHSFPATSTTNGWIPNNQSTLTKSPTNHGVNDLSHKIRQDLDRSIAKHMEKGPQISIDPLPRSLDETSATHAFNKSASDYLSTLQRNFFV